MIGTALQTAATQPAATAAATLPLVAPFARRAFWSGYRTAAWADRVGVIPR